jgi:hypothetical protein
MTKSKTKNILGALAVGASVFSTAGHAQTTPQSSAVTVPPAGNYGSTSFYDGFGRVTEGFTLLQYGRYESLDSINGSNGRPLPFFKGTDLDVFVSLTQISYTSDWHPFGGDGVGFSFALPVVDLNAHFATDSPAKLGNNNFNIGDAVFGPIYQSHYYMDGDRPEFAWRFQLLILAPTGGYNKADAVNQTSGMWAINPYIATTYAPTPDIEFSTRFNYQYNLKTSELQAPMNPTFKNGQAGQMIYDNFDTSVKMTTDFEVGINGYFIYQLTDNKTNGYKIPDSKEVLVYLGPGARYVVSESDALNFNLYFNVLNRNGTSGTIFNTQWIHRF